MSLVELGWRRFNFFDRDLVKDPENNEQAFLGLQELEAVCICRGQTCVLIGEASGGICQLGKDYQLQYWRAYRNSLSYMCYIKQENILVSVGEDEPGVNSQIKVWHLDRVVETGTEKGKPFCSRISRTNPPNNRSAKATCLAVHSTLFYMAVGFEDSTFLLYRGEVTKEKHNAKPMVLRDGVSNASDGAISGLAFHMLPDRRLVLFITTSHVVLSFVLREKEVEKVNKHDARGCSPTCWAMCDALLDFQFIVARRDMVYFYNPDQCAVPEDASIGKCHEFERDKDKTLIRVAGSYLLLVTREVSAIDIKPDTRMNMVTIYDIAGQYIAYSAPVPEVSDVFAQWGSFFVLCKNGKLYKLQDKDIKTKLDVLFRKNLYDVAIGLAKRYYCNEESLEDIFKQHGDYLYQKGDYENAVKQYMQTIGTLEPSYVIRRFLDAQRIDQLTQYLEALHKRCAATADHTTILLNCYTKLNHKDKIEMFVNADQKELSFDVDTAIKVLRSAGYIDQALNLATKHQRHDMCLYLLLENMGNYASAAEYISNLSYDLAEQYMKKYGKILLREVPDKTTCILKELCTGVFCTETQQTVRASADEFINIFLNDSVKLREFLEHMAQVEPNSNAHLYNTLLELYLRAHNESPSPEANKTIMDFLRDENACYDVDQACVLCQMHDFAPGILFLYEKSSMYQMILQYHMARKDYASVVRTCTQYAREAANKDMWVEALWFVARHEDAPTDCVAELLKNIDELEILPPLMVLEILSHSQTVTLGVVKEYLINWLMQENEKIAEDEALIKTYQQDVAKTEAVIDDLQNNAQVFQVSKCSACDTALEVPTVHFLCKHSYHQHCFESYAETDAECPACLPENKKLKSVLSAQRKNSKDTYQQFRTELQTSGNSMATVADHFGKGLFERLAELSVKVHQQTRSAAPSVNPFDDD